MEGNMENSSGSLTYSVINNITRDKDRLMVRRISIMGSLSGRIISNTINTMIMAIKTSANFIPESPSPQTCFPLMLYT